MLEPIAKVLGVRSSELEEVDLVPRIHQVLAQQKRPSVLQVVILRDGLLIGTEVFVAGQYTVGSGADCDLRLDDPSVAALHASLSFAPGRIELEAAGGDAYVNGHPVKAALLRPIDDVLLGAFSLKVRVLTQRRSQVERTVEIVPAPATEAKTEVIAIPLPPPAPRGRLLLELYWGETRQHARAFGDRPIKQPITGGLDDLCAMPLWGFELERAMRLADAHGDGYRVFVPPGAAVERRGSSGTFAPITADQRGPSFTLEQGDAVRFASGDSTLVASVVPFEPRIRLNPFAGAPHLALGLTALFLGFFLAFATFAPSQDEADFALKAVPRVQIHPTFTLPKPLELVKVADNTPKDTGKKTPPTPTPTATPKNHPVSRPRPPHFADLLASGGEAIKNLTTPGAPVAIAPGSRGHRRSLGAMLGASPVETSMLGLGGDSIRGLEALHHDGIGAMGLRDIGKHGVNGRVDHPSARSVGITGGIDRDAVTKVIDEHLHEISSCYERGLLQGKDLGGGKLLLEWTISTSGVVTSARTKSSTMKSSVAEGCILRAIKTWPFPKAKGAGVVITYPFLFHSVG